MEAMTRQGLRPLERIVLVGVWVMSCAVVYGLGFYTGSHSPDRVPDDEERIVRLPVTAELPPAGQRAKADEGFTFYDSLMPNGSRAKPGDALPVVVPVPVPASPVGSTGAKAKPGTAAAKAPTKPTRATGLAKTGGPTVARTNAAAAGSKSNASRKGSAAPVKGGSTSSTSAKAPPAKAASATRTAAGAAAKPAPNATPPSKRLVRAAAPAAPPVARPPRERASVVAAE